MVGRPPIFPVLRGWRCHSPEISPSCSIFPGILSDKPGTPPTTALRSRQPLCDPDIRFTIPTITRDHGGPGGGGVKNEAE